MPTPKYDPDLLDRLDRRRKKKRRDSFLSRILLILLIISFITAIFFIRILLNRGTAPKEDGSKIETLWFEQTFSVLFYTPTGTETSTPTATVPSPTITSTATETPTISPTPTITATPRLRTRTPAVGDELPTSTPLLLLNAAETEISRLKAAETTTNIDLTPLATPDAWYEMQGQPGAINAEMIYPNANCSWMGVAGLVNDARGDPIVGLYIQVGNFDDGEIRETLSGLYPIYGDSGYEITIARPVQEIKNPLWIQLLNEAHVPISEKTYFKPSDRCERSLILINFQRVK